MLLLLRGDQSPPPSPGTPGRRGARARLLRADATLTACRAVTGTLDGPVATRRRRRDDARTVVAAPGMVWRSDVVHLQEDSSWGAATCALCAHLLHRPVVVTVVGPPVAVARRAGRRRPRALGRALAGPVVRSASRVVVASRLTGTEMLARGVDPDRLELSEEAAGPAGSEPSGPSARRAVAYRRIYRQLAEGMVARRRPPAGTWAAQPTELRRRRRLVIGAAVLVAVGLTVVVTGPLPHQVAISLRRQADRHSAVFFVRPLALPSVAHVRRRVAFSFAVANRDPTVGIYHYTVTESSAGRTRQVGGGSLEVPVGRTAVRRVRVVAARIGRRLVVRVTVMPGDLSVAYHLRVLGR